LVFLGGTDKMSGICFWPRGAVRAKGKRATFVGRDNELALLKDSLAADAGRPWIVLAGGEPGIGRRRCCARILAAGVFHRPKGRGARGGADE
jgi:hypothetical protein